jgi:hypothetical protein
MTDLVADISFFVGFAVGVLIYFLLDDKND